jgi:two-component system, NtrC family, response regulator AtoC
MLEYGWWGNVRELKNAMERASFLCENGPLLPEHLPSDPTPEDEKLEAEPTAAHDRYTLSESPTMGLGAFSSTSSLRPSQREWAIQRGLLPPPNSAPPNSAPIPSSPATGTPMASCLDGENEAPRPLDPEHQRILLALRECGGNQTRAARLLGMSRRTLINRLNEYGLPRPRKGRDAPPMK